MKYSDTIMSCKILLAEGDPKYFSNKNRIIISHTYFTLSRNLLPEGSGQISLVLSIFHSAILIMVFKIAPSMHAN
jgi:hypothetical protein